MSSRNWLAALAAIASLTFASFAAVAQDHSYTDDGPVVSWHTSGRWTANSTNYMDWLKTLEAAAGSGH